MRLAMMMLVLVGLIEPLQAHSWYDHECCSDRDCHPLADGDVMVRIDGYYIQSLGWLIPYGSAIIRFSADEHYHVCEMIVYHSTQGAMKQPRCFYIPGQSY